MAAEKFETATDANQTAYNNGWGRIAVPLKPGQKSPTWDGWSNPNNIYTSSSEIEDTKFDPASCDARGEGVGLRTGLDIGDGTCLLGIDIDVKDWPKVARIMALVKKHFGEIVTRMGLPPKVLVPIRVSVASAAGWKPSSIQVGDGYKVEIMYQGRQFVWEGIHPDTLKPYTNSKDILRHKPDALGVVDMSVVKSFWKELETEFGVSGGSDSVSPEVAGNSSPGGAGGVVRLDVERAISACMRGEDIHENLGKITASLVNDGMDGDMVRSWLLGRNLPAGLPREQDRLGDMFDARSELGRLIEGAVEKYGKGSKWEFLNDGLRGVASGAKAAVGEFSVASKVGASLPEDDPFAVPSEAEMVVEKMVAALMKPKPPKFALVKDGWDTPKTQLPPTPWLDAGYLFLRGAAIAVQGKAEVNKSTWMLNYVLHLMTGVGGAAFGAEMQMFPDGRACITDEDRAAAGLSLKVLYLSADDPASVVKKRVAAWADYWGVTGAALASLNGRFMVLSVTEGVMDLRIDTPEGVAELRDMVKREGIDLVLGDPAANLLPAADGDNVEALGAMKRVIGALSDLQVAGCLVFHTRKSANAESAESTLDDIRGASAVGGAIRGSFAMRRLFPKEMEAFNLDPKGNGLNVRILVHAKNNYGPRLPDRYYQVAVVDLLNRGMGPGETSPVLVPYTPSAAAGVPPHEIQTFITLLVRGDEDGNPFTDSPQAKTRSVYAMTDVELGWDEAKTKRVIKDLVGKKVVSKGEVNVGGYEGRSKPKVMKGLIVIDETYDPVADSNEQDPFAE